MKNENSKNLGRSSNECQHLLNNKNLYSGDIITASMEAYLGMVYRYCKNGRGNNLHKKFKKAQSQEKPADFFKKDSVKITTLAKNLNVKPSSVSKMVGNLKKSGFVECEKYGTISLTEKGKEYAKYLLKRHKILHEFFCAINHSTNEFEQVERVEHFFTLEATKNIDKLNRIIKQKNIKL